MQEQPLQAAAERPENEALPMDESAAPVSEAPESGASAAAGEPPSPELAAASQGEAAGEPASVDEPAGEPAPSDDAAPADAETGTPTVSGDGPASTGAEPAGEADDAPSAPETASASVSADELIGGEEQPADKEETRTAELKAVLEAIVYVLNDPLPATQIAAALGRPVSEVEPVLKLLAEETNRPDRGVFIREVAGGYQMATKPEHHEVIRTFFKNLKQPLKLSQAALETLAVIAYKQPITLPEILDIRGVQGGGVLKTLLDRKLIVTAGRKNVVGKPMLYKTSKDFLTQFGLKDLAELPTLKEFEEIRRQSMADDELPFDAPPDDAAPAGTIVSGEETVPVEGGASAGEAAPTAAGAPSDEPGPAALETPETSAPAGESPAGEAAADAAPEAPAGQAKENG